MAWVLYVALLVARYRTGWGGRQAALLGIAGFVLVVFTFACDDGLRGPGGGPTLTAMIFIVGVSHRTAPLEIREALAFPRDSLPEALHRMRAEAGLTEAMILSTCNRVELYGRAPTTSTRVRWLGFLCAFHRRAADGAGAVRLPPGRAQRRCATPSAWRPASTRW